MSLTYYKNIDNIKHDIYLKTLSLLQESKTLTFASLMHIVPEIDKKLYKKLEILLL